MLARRGRLVLDGDLGRVVAGTSCESRRICAGMVAEKSATCFSAGVLGQDRLDVLGEAHVEHLVGLVEHQEAQLAQVEGALVEVVHDAARRADDDVHAAAQRAELDAVALAAVDRQHVHAGQVPGVLLERLADLERELAGGREDERLRLLLAQVEPREHRQRERRRLAGAGLREPDDVSPVEHGRDRRGLDGRRGLVADLVDGGQHAWVEPELGEGQPCRLIGGLVGHGSTVGVRGPHRAFVERRLRGPSGRG